MVKKKFHKYCGLCGKCHKDHSKCEEKTKTCKHRFKQTGHSGQIRLMRCEKCGFGTEKPHTKTSLKAHKASMRKMFRKDDQLHAPFHEFCRLTKDTEGYPSMLKAETAFEKVKKKWPGRILYVHCDDDHHANSDIYLVTHERGRKGWMGVTVQYFPQCTGEKPIRFFLYPHDLRTMVKQLTKLQERMEKRIGKGSRYG